MSHSVFISEIDTVRDALTCQCQSCEWWRQARYSISRAHQLANRSAAVPITYRAHS